MKSIDVVDLFGRVTEHIAVNSKFIRKLLISVYEIADPVPAIQIVADEVDFIARYTEIFNTSVTKFGAGNFAILTTYVVFNEKKSFYFFNFYIMDNFISNFGYLKELHVSVSTSDEVFECSVPSLYVGDLIGRVITHGNFDSLKIIITS